MEFNLKKSFTCDFENCNKSYTTKGHLTRHQQSHSGKKFKCDFPNCGKTYTQKDNLKIHEKIHDDGNNKEEFKCNFQLKEI
jgi:uncharacterized Zn-finger protein